MSMQSWLKRVKCLALVAIFISFGNCITTWKAGAIVTPLEAIPGVLLLFFCAVVGHLLYELANCILPKNLPAIVYISFVAILSTVPGLPWAAFATANIGKIGIMPACTPILAYAGISLGKDLDAFRKQGPAIVLVSLFAFTRTYVGSAIIAQIILSVTGVI